VRRTTAVRSVVVLFALCASGRAGVLPDDRADALYHRYEGGGIQIQGPSILLRKKIGDSVSLSYNYYVDSITGHVDTVSGASVDAISGASEYKERRTQHSLGVDFLHGKTTYSGGYISSKENDYDAKTGYLSVSQDMFGDLTNISFGYTVGKDTVGQRGNPDFALDPAHRVTRRNWQVGLSQVLTRNLLLSANFETSESEGFLNNPYRKVRYLDQGEARGYGTQFERYPHTRTGNAGSLQLKYYLPWRAAVDGSYRLYSDTWGILAHTGRLGYTQPAFHHWTFEGRARYYKQNHADFFSDLFPYQNAFNFLARDRELASFTSLTLGGTATWEFPVSRVSFLQKGTLNLSWDRLRISYDDYRDLSSIAVTPGTEPLFTLNANVLQFFISVWY
jgi:hypothetical protein